MLSGSITLLVLLTSFFNANFALGPSSEAASVTQRTHNLQNVHRQYVCSRVAVIKMPGQMINDALLIPISIDFPRVQFNMRKPTQA